MIELVQDHRPIGVETPLGKDKLLLTAFVGEERLSGLFTFDLQMISDEASIKPDQIVGKRVDLFVRHQDEEPQYFNGFVSRFGYSGKDDRVHRYRAQVVPWLWFLTKATDCKVHETGAQQNAQDIIDGLLNDLGFSDYKWDLKRTPEKRDYCVQYRESHYDFVARLLAEEGIFYYFKHEKGKHELVMTDHVEGVFDCKDDKVQLLSNLSQPEQTDNLSDWNHDYEFTTGKFAHTDYDFENPATSLLANKNTLVSLPDNSKYEYYDHPGLYVDKGLGDSLAQLRMEEEEARFNSVTGTSECRSFSPGGRFEVADHHNDGEKGGKWVLTIVQHNAQQGGSYLTGAAHSDEIYHNSFRCIPSDVVFRPPFRPKPRIFGIQSAETVGPAGEEIYTDEHGRVKVQFHWDRLGGKDEKSSNWVRVSQVHAGQGWGMMDIPRIGEEVIVSFLNGDPDRPLIVGRVYNGQNTPPFALPAEKTRRGNSTKTHKGAGYNELSMDDTAGKEQLRINAQYNMDSNINNCQTENVGVDRTRIVGNNETVTVGSMRNHTVKINENIMVGAAQTISVGGAQTISVGAVQAITVGAAQATTVVLSQNNNIGVSQDTNVKVNRSVDVGAGQTTKIGKDQSITVGKNQAVSIGDNQTIKVGKKLAITAGDEISIVTGKAKIVMKKDGTIQITGKDITIDGSGQINVKAKKDIVMKGKKILQN